MPSYVNPSTMMGGQLSPKSALHGALAGIQGGYATKMADQQIRDTDQDFMANMQKYEQAKADEPLNDAKRSAGIAEAGYLEQLIASGKKGQAFDADLENKFLDAQTKKQTIDEKEVEQRGDFLVRVAGMVDKFNEQDPATVGEWGQIVDEGKKKGVQLPSWPSPQHKEMIKARAATYINTAKHQQKQAELKTTADLELRNRADPRVATSTAAQLQLEEMRGNKARDVAREGADSRREVAEMRQTQVKTLQHLAIEEAKKGNIQGAIAMYLKTYETPLETLPGPMREARLKEATAWAEGVAAGAKATGAPKAGAKEAYTPAQEAKIKAAMDANPGSTREEIIKAAKDAKKL